MKITMKNYYVVFGYFMTFYNFQNSVKSPPPARHPKSNQNAGNGISGTLDLKMFQGHSPDPR